MKMKLDSFIKSSTDAWKEILTGFVSTVLGIAVTIGVDNRLEDKQAEEDKRNLTIMIIHDLDESELQMRASVDLFRRYFDKAEYVFTHLDQIDEIQEDTLVKAMQFLAFELELNPVKFPQMAENILINNMSNWTTLSNVKFMSNAELCFAYRKRFNETLVDQETYVPARKLYRLYYDKDHEAELDLDGMRKLVSEFYETKTVSHYIAESKWVLERRCEYIASLHQLNSENKWLMSVSSEDIGEYIKASSKRAPAQRSRVTKEAVIGTWQMDLDHERGIRRYVKSLSITFNPDNTYDIVRMTDAKKTSVDTAYTYADTIYGHWRLEGNDLIRITDSIKSASTDKSSVYNTVVEHLARFQAKTEKDTASNRAVMSDILLSDTEMSAMEYDEGEEDKAYLIHYRRK